MLDITGKAWDQFRTRVIGMDAPQQYVEEMQMAFYAGWAAFVVEVRANTSLPNEVAVARLHAIQDELDEFGRILLKRQHDATQELAAGAAVGTFGAN